MIPRALSVTEPEKGGKPLEIPGTEEKETQKKDKTRKERKKCGQYLYAQGDKKGKKRPPAKTSCLNSSFLTLHSGVVYQDKNATARRISSARLHRIKELKNEKFDLRRRIEASSLENQALKELNRRHTRAIERYSSAESHLQGLLAGHQNDRRHLSTLLKMSQEAERNTARELKKVEAELRRTEGDLKTLAALSEDKALAEREELNHRLAVLNETLEAKEERIQSLEMQLKLNNSTFSHQLASESKKLLEATMTTKDLLMEINIVHQKIKEKDRQLYVQNIYANRMPKALRDRSDWVPNGQSLRVDRSAQVDKESFRELLSQHQETGKNPIQLKKEKRRDKGRKGKAKEVCSDAQGRKEKQAAKKVPMPETSNRTHRGSRVLMEECNFSEFIKEMKKETEFLEQELKSLMKSEENLQNVRIKNSQEGEAVKVEKEEKKTYKQQKKEARSEGAVPSKDFARQKKKIIISSEAIENLQRGLHTSGAKSKAGSLSSQSQAGQSCRDTAECRGKSSFGAYEPSLGQILLAGQDSTSGVQGCRHLLPSERKTPGGALWGGLFARRQPQELQQHKGEGRQVRGAWQIPNSMTGSNSPH
ncbi:lebercilin-like protein [Cinclus cinclus]|uniref:lebercilin-like protein n=1 Tax=Cinclus cinclus TaxID=127875 RepID=UPI002E130791